MHIGINAGQSGGIALDKEVSEAAADASQAAQEGASFAAKAGSKAAAAGKQAALDRAKSMKSSMEAPKVNLNLSIFDGLTEKFKIACAYAQVTSLFYETLKIPWPSEVKALYAAMGTFNFDIFQIFSVGCVVGDFYQTFFAVMAIPPMIVAMFAWVYVIGNCFVKAPIIKRVWLGQVLHKASISLFMVYPTISKTVLQMWATYEGGTPVEGKTYLAVDMRISPSDPGYPWYATAAAFFFGAYVIGIPAFVSAVRYRPSALFLRFGP
jgi:hypothetical protein